MRKLVSAVLCLALLGGLFTMALHVQPLQAGDGSMIVEARCTICHGAGRIEQAGYDREGWKPTVDRMMGKSNFGPKLSEVEREALLDYLSTL